MKVDPAANARHGAETGGRITASTRPMAAVVATNEELQIAIETAEIVREHPAPRAGRGPVQASP